MDTLSSILLVGNIISFLSGIFSLIIFFKNILSKKGSIYENKNYLIAAFVFIVVEPVLIYWVGRAVAGYKEEILFDTLITAFANKT
ncbi:MAG: hypothetical protein QXG86_00595 [Candidatus Woesearchaeota archaeon]